MSGPRPDTWMPLYIGDYLADTMHLSRDQHGAYMLLIMAYWRRGAPLPDDDERLAGIAKATPNEWRKLRPVLAEFFLVADGKWVQRRAQAELDRASNNVSARSKAGSNGAAKRWQPDGKTDGKTIAPASQNDGPLPLPLPSLPSGEKAPARGLPSGCLAPIPKDWSPDEGIRMHAVTRGIPERTLAEQAELFRDHHLGKGTMMADPNAMFRKWLASMGQFERRDGSAKPAKTGFQPYIP